MNKAQHMLEFTDNMRAGIYSIGTDYIVSFHVPFDVVMKMMELFVEHEKSSGTPHTTEEDNQNGR